MTQNINKTQIRIGTYQGRKRAQYRTMLADGRWQDVWHHLTIGEALRSVRTGTWNGMEVVSFENLTK